MKVEIREARPGDKEPLMSFIREVWGGHDYIPYVWDEWIRDMDAKMYVALADGVQVGMSRVRFLEDGSAWFEGARVHPDYRGMRIAAALGERAMKSARERGVRVFRLTSGSWNKSAHRSIARIGFGETARMSVYAPSKGARFGLVLGVRTVGKEGAEDAFRKIRNSREFRLGSGVMWDSFAAEALTKEIVTQESAAGRLYTTGDALAISRQGGERRERWRQVCFLCGNPAGAVRLVRYIFGRKEPFRTDRRLAYVPQGSRLIGHLRKAGLIRDFSLILFERRAAKG